MHLEKILLSTGIPTAKNLLLGVRGGGAACRVIGPGVSPKSGQRRLTVYALERVVKSVVDRG